MQKYVKPFAFFLILSLITFSTKILAQEIPKPDFTCLTRPQKEQIVACFEQNTECHQALAKATSEPVQDSWGILIAASLMGVIGGLIIAHQYPK